MVSPVRRRNVRGTILEDTIATMGFRLRGGEIVRT
jgi:hypothetical protein